MRCLRIWCLINIDLTLSYTYMLPYMGPHNCYCQTPHPQTPHPLCIYIYIYIERERERDIHMLLLLIIFVIILLISIVLYIYIYIYSRTILPCEVRALADDAAAGGFEGRPAMYAYIHI